MTYDNPPIITSTMRRYNPKTTRYESVVTDPWAGAPKGIRVISSIAGGLFVMLEDSFVYKAQGGGTWVQGSQTDVAKEVAWHASIGSEFPDFDGAPEGQRFYVDWGKGDLQPAVDTGDGVHVLIRGEWWKQDGVYGLKWYSKNFADVILVDPAPEEPKPIPSEVYYYYDLVGRGKLNAKEVRSAHLVIAVNDEGKVRVEKSRHFAQSLT